MSFGLPAAQVHAFVAVDISSSMQGSKLEQVCASLQDIIVSNEGNVNFEITTFAGRASVAAVGTKFEIRVAELVKEIQDGCGGTTAFFDAWGEIVERIPDSVFQNDDVQIILLTDGEDNASKRHDLTSVKKLMYAKMTARTKFRFIQMGEGSNKKVIETLSKMPGVRGQGAGASADIQAVVTDDSARGIRSALISVRDDILTSSRRSATDSGIGGSGLRSQPPPYAAVVGAGAGMGAGAHPLLTTRRVAASATGAHGQAQARAIGGGSQSQQSAPKLSAPALSKSASVTGTGSYKLC